MVFHLDTWYENQDNQGSSVACLKLELKHANNEFRDKIKDAIMQVMVPEQPVETKPNVLGFHVDE